MFWDENMFGLSRLFCADVQPRTRTHIHTRELCNSLVVDCLYSAACSRGYSLMLCRIINTHTQSVSASNSVIWSDKREKKNGINYRGENNTQHFSLTFTVVWRAVFCLSVLIVRLLVLLRMQEMIAVMNNCECRIRAWETESRADGLQPYVYAVEVDAPVGAGAGRDEAISVFTWWGQRRVGGSQCTHDLCGFLQENRRFLKFRFWSQWIELLSFS